VKLHGQLAVGALDLLLVRGAADPENLVIITFGLSSQWFFLFLPAALCLEPGLVAPPLAAAGPATLERGAA
jgi:hypothetical protein